MTEFFTQLQVFSERFFDSLNIDERTSPWGLEGYATDGPIGAIMHFTADDDLDRVVKWFMRKRYGAKVSANVVIADRIYGSTEEMMGGLPLIKELPVTVVQCRPPEKPTYHATWTNPRCYGIEMLNVGELRESGQGLVSHWPRDDQSAPWTLPWKHPLKKAHEGWGRLWEPYTAEQAITCVAVLRYLRELYPDLDPSWVVGHENVQGLKTIGAGRRDKRDPGPLLPTRLIRETAFGVEWLGMDWGWAQKFQDNPDFCAKDRSRTVQIWAAYKRQQTALEAEQAMEDAERTEAQKRRIGRKEELPSPVVSWTRFESAFKAMVNDGHSKFGAVGKTALSLLGYYIPVIHDDMADEDRTALWLFQKLMGLKADSIPGRQTRKALLERMIDRGIL